MNNPPLTFVINLMNITMMIAGKSAEMMVPMNLGALFTGSTITHLFPNKMAEKYTDGNEALLKVCDIIVHWVPSVVLLNMYGRKVENRHVHASLILPLLYFSFKQTKNTFEVTNPIEHTKKAYPGVPLWVFAMYAVGALSMYKKKC